MAKGFPFSQSTVWGAKSGISSGNSDCERDVMPVYTGAEEERRPRQPYIGIAIHKNHKLEWNRVTGRLDFLAGELSHKKTGM